MEDDSVSGKVFVGGMAWNTTEYSLRQHFSQFGEVVSSFIIKDRRTDNSRGFGFVTFVDPSSAESAIGHGRHVIDGRSVDVKRAKPRGEQHRHQNSRNQLPANHPVVQDSSGGSTANATEHHRRTKRLFVGGLKADHIEEDLRSYFERFGRIDDIAVLYDAATSRSRGFGFVSFESEEVVDNILQNNFHEIGGKRVEVKKAISKEESNHRFASSSSSRNGGDSEYRYHHPNNYASYGDVGGYYYGYNYHGYQYPLAAYYGMPYPGPWSYIGMYGTGYYPYVPGAYYNASRMNGGCGDADSSSTSNGVLDPGPSRNCDQDFGHNVEAHDKTDSQAQLEQQIDDKAENFDSEHGSGSGEGSERALVENHLSPKLV